MISLMVALILVLTVVPISASAANTNYTMDDISSKQIFAKKNFCARNGYQTRITNGKWKH